MQQHISSSRVREGSFLKKSFLLILFAKSPFRSNSGFLFNNAKLAITISGAMVSAKLTYLPGEPVNTSATKNGCDKKRSILRARATTSLSSSESSSKPKIAIIS